MIVFIGLLNSSLIFLRKLKNKVELHNGKMKFIKRFILALLTPFNYLFYKLYVFMSYLSFSDTPVSHMSAMSLLITLNIITIYTALYGSPPPNKFLISLILLVPYAFPKVADKIVSKYENESEESFILGNIAVIVYIALSIFFLFKVLCFYKK